MPPKVAIHSRAMIVGTISTQVMNSRTVRPKLMRPMNMPTKGAQAIHQAQ